MTSDHLPLAVDRDSAVPLATQLAWKLRTFVATGVLAPGDRLPGVRELAERAAVNVNTARGVYGRLEDEGLITSQHGRGTFVAAGATASGALARVVAGAVEEARQAGLDPREVAAALFAGAPAGSTQGADATERGRRRALRAEIARLEGDLAQLEGLGAQPPGSRPRGGGQILGAPELEEIRDRLVSRVAALRSERAQARRQVEQARQTAPATSPARAPGDARVWRPGGVWTGVGPSGIVYES